jgi:hypothetical protein
VENLKFSRITETSSTDTSANDTDDAAAGGLEDDAGACNNRGRQYTVNNLTYIDNNAFNDAFYLFYSSDSKQNTQTLFAY